MHLKYAKMLAIVVHENMKLGGNTLDNERLSPVNTEFHIWAIQVCAWGYSLSWPSWWGSAQTEYLFQASGIWKGRVKYKKEFYGCENHRKTSWFGVIYLYLKDGTFTIVKRDVTFFILLHEKFLQFDWFRAVVFQLNLKYLHVKITNLLQVVV